ncbi:MAG: molecular chaperone DnaJ, partial [bacterium]
MIGKKGSDLNFNSQIALEEAFRGTTVSIKIPKLETCPTCYGQGVLNESTKCRTCKGQAKIISEKAFNINIPPGIKDGERLCMVDEGEAGFEGGPAGDLYVNVLVRQHPLFQRQENDLYYTANITNNQSGQTIEVLMLDGQTINVDIPVTASDETVIPIIGQGMPLVGQTDRGN